MTDPATASPEPQTDAAADSPQKRTWTQHIDVAGDQLIAKVRHLAAEGQVRRIRITEPDGDLVLEVPLTIGAIAGGALALAAPFLAVIGALAAVVTRVKIEVTRDVDPSPASPMSQTSAPVPAPNPEPATTL